MQTVLFLQVGHTYESIAAERGDYDAWFRRGLAHPGLSFEARPIYAGAPLPSHFDYAAVVVSGSFAMVTDRAPWSEATALYLRTATERGLAVLGVCYGHQLLAHALGGEVVLNPQGRHAGTARVHTTDEAAHDPLFSGLPRELTVQVSHRQHVARLPAGAVLLAFAERDPHQAFRIGTRAWGVQFHPEFDAAVSRAYIETRRAILEAEGIDVDRLLTDLRDSDHGARLLRRFAELVAG